MNAGSQCQLRIVIIIRISDMIELESAICYCMMPTLHPTRLQIAKLERHCECKPPLKGHRTTAVSWQFSKLGGCHEFQTTTTTTTTESGLCWSPYTIVRCLDYVSVPLASCLIVSDPIKRGLASGCRGWDPRHGAEARSIRAGRLGCSC